MVSRILTSQICDYHIPGKAIVIIGPRRVGKTTVLKMFLEKTGDPELLLHGDEPQDRALLEEASLPRLKTILAKVKLLVIDEAQEVENIGRTLKLITDYLPDIRLIVSGSSAFELRNRLNEPLTGRKQEFILHPFSFSELVGHFGLKQELEHLETRMIFGAYPEIVMDPLNAREHLRELISSYMYKDLFKLESVPNPFLLEKILKAVAFQIGSEASYREIGEIAGCSTPTVEKYLQLLERTYIIFRLSALSRNERSEIKKGKKIYFYDNGIRNALIGNFSHLPNRQDTGALWENFVISERMKYLNNKRFHGNTWFWRTFQQQEIDYIEEIDGKFHAYEFKWNPKKEARFSKTFLTSYPESTTKTITPANFESFLSEIQ
jgi:predicted AAA+ superfamily ATPase